ncbi:hypothetical protein B0H15DRAFT_803287 [Mycena belliarum]|uniref:Zn(2)-C6 fungal-type domain-containing protein n=1 Tax=Mycena belliarum TaxID=1033014 RepID=A0AAD6TXW5_9AGAR|nr:hypothetical protein B0H15DRAFT_803287 [Mycena belliae]
MYHMTSYHLIPNHQPNWPSPLVEYLRDPCRVAPRTEGIGDRPPRSSLPALPPDIVDVESEDEPRQDQDDDQDQDEDAEHDAGYDVDQDPMDQDEEEPPEEPKVAMFPCTECHSFNDQCFERGPGVACLPCAKRGIKCSHEATGVQRMLLQERAEKFTAGGSSALIARLAAILQARRQVDLFRALTTHAFHRFNEALRHLAWELIQTGAEIPRNLEVGQGAPLTADSEPELFRALASAAPAPPKTPPLSSLDAPEPSTPTRPSTIAARPVPPFVTVFRPPRPAPSTPGPSGWAGRAPLQPPAYGPPPPFPHPGYPYYPGYLPPGSYGPGSPAQYYTGPLPSALGPSPLAAPAAPAPSPLPKPPSDAARPPLSPKPPVGQSAPLSVEESAGTGEASSAA